MKEQGYGADYAYDHDAEDGFSGQNYFPDGMKRPVLYHPVERGFERDLKKRLDWFAKLRLQRETRQNLTLAACCDRSAMLTTPFPVALGGAIGASARYLVGLGALRVMGHGFPWGDAGGQRPGIARHGGFVVFLAQRAARFAPLLVTGVLGGFTTFSAFSLDAVTIYRARSDGAAGIYVVSVGGLVAALIAGGLWRRGGCA